MKLRAARAWLWWLLLAAFASCLNPKPDDEPLAIPGQEVPLDPNGASSGANDGPPILSEGSGSENPRQQPNDVADAGVPSGDAGTTSGDAGPL